VKPDPLVRRINKLPKWARDYIHNVHTFVGAPEVQDLFLRDQNSQLIRLVAELKPRIGAWKRRLANAGKLP
jgi:hypothetical protein